MLGRCVAHGITRAFGVLGADRRPVFMGLLRRIAG